LGTDREICFPIEVKISDRYIRNGSTGTWYTWKKVIIKCRTKATGAIARQDHDSRGIEVYQIEDPVPVKVSACRRWKNIRR
jgi:hypothetical protein